MEIFTLLETLEDLLENSKGLPFTTKSVVDKEEMLDLIKEIRIKLPDELKQAKWVKEERQRILVEAQKEADGIVKEAENRIISMIDEHEITRKAYEQKAEIRIKLPDELKQAKWVKEERQRILVEAQKEADGIVKEAENRIISMIDEHEITRKAYEQKAEIIETANEMSREISSGTKEYADSLLANTEDVLNETLNKLGKNMTEALNLMQISLEDTLKTIQNSRKELK